MKVLFIQPPIEDFYTTNIRNYPLGLLFIASNLKDICDVKIVDLRVGSKEIESPFNELNKFYNKRYSPYKLFSRYQRFGLNQDRIRDIIKKEKPKVVGISNLFCTYSEEALEVAKIAKEVDEKIITVLGGNHPTLFPEDVLKKTFVDIVIRGEGDIPFRELVRKLISGGKLTNIEGVSFKTDGKLYLSLPFFNTSCSLNLDRALIPKENYPYGKGFIAPVITSRGCPYHCDFCGKPETRFGYYHIDDVKKDIDKLINLGFDTIDIEDDFFDITLPRNMEILKWLGDKKIRITAMNGIVPKINDKAKEILKSINFQRINLSLVDSNDELKEEINRGHFKEADTVLNQFISTGIPIEVHFIIGLPDQSPEGLINTMLYLAEKKVLLGPSVYYLAPGSKIYENYVKKYGRIDFKFARSSVLFPVNKNFDVIALATFMRLTRFVNYIKSLLDKYGQDFHIKELMKVVMNKKEIDGKILETLIERKTFISFDKTKKKFYEDYSKKYIIEDFLSKLRFIRGYKSENICYFKI